jgi:hypothetical protein
MGMSKVLGRCESNVHANEHGYGSFGENFGVFPAQSRNIVALSLVASCDQGPGRGTRLDSDI